jgi:ABC-type antimicrobial peptide transport system permease subunit
VRSIVRELTPDWPVHNVEPLDDRLGRTFAQPRFYAVTLALFAALAVSTAVLGLYGVLSYSVERRRIEFGIRRALGADERHILLLTIRRAAGLAAVGLILGLGIASVAAGLLRAVLFGIHPLDPASYGAAMLLVALVVLAAAWQPARRALAVDPARALRTD